MTRVVKPISRRSTIRGGVLLALSAVGVGTASAEPIDGKGNDVCPCAFGIDRVVLAGDGTIAVSGPCSVASPPEEVTVDVAVRGGSGARAIGRETFVCEDDDDGFSVTARIRGIDRFEAGEDVEVHARVRVDADDAPAVTGRWEWAGELTD